MVIYKISNTVNDKIYIGSSINFNRRKSEHKRELLKNKHGNSKLQRFANKYGIDKINFEVIEEVDCKENLLVREQYYLDVLKPYFNVYKVAGSPIGYKHTEESKIKIGLASKGNKYRLGKKQIVSKETGLKISLALMGEKHPMYGKKLSEEHKIKIGLGNKGKKVILGKKHSYETKKKMSLAQKGRPRCDSKLILDTKIGIYYETVNECARVYNLKQNTLWCYLNGIFKNKTNLIYI